MKTTVLILALLTFLASLGQVSQPTPNRPASTPASVPTSMAAVGPEMNAMLSNLQRAAEQTSMDLGRLSVKKWKADSAFKDQTQHDISSVQSNVSASLPGLISQVRSNPDSVVSLFKLYRNVDALLDVVRGVAESAGAFGSKSEFDALQADSHNLSSVRASLAAQLDSVAVANESAFSRTKAQLAQLQAAAAAAPPKKIIVDDNESAKKPARKKKPAPAKPTAQTPPSQSQPTKP